MARCEHPQLDGQQVISNKIKQLEKATGGRMVMHGSVKDIRDMYDNLVAMLMPQLPPPSDATESFDGEVEGVKYRVYTPKEAAKQDPSQLPSGLTEGLDDWRSQRRRPSLQNRR